MNQETRTAELQQPAAARAHDTARRALFRAARHWGSRIPRPWIAFGAIASMLAVAVLMLDDDSPSSARPLLVPATIGDVEQLVTAAGALEAGAYVDVGAQVSGQLQRLHVQVGETVAEGELLAEIDARVQLNRVEASRANLKADEALMSARQAALELAQANVTRQQELVRENLTTQEDLDTAISNLAAAESALVELESRIARSSASLASDEAQLGYSRIYAPTAGTVVSISMTEGQTLNASQHVPTILRIANLDTMTVRAEVSEADVNRVVVNTEVYFTTLGGGERRWHGRVKQIQPTPTVIDNVVSYPVLFDVANEDRALLPGMTTQVFLIVSAVRNVLTIPLGAITFEPAAASDATRRSATVRVMLDQQETEIRTIEVGMTNRISAEVVSGLSAGEKVVAGIVEPSRYGGG